MGRRVWRGVCGGAWVGRGTALLTAHCSPLARRPAHRAPLTTAAPTGTWSEPGLPPHPARDEIEQSLTMRCFDKIVINDKLDDAYIELTQTLLEL